MVLVLAGFPRLADGDTARVSEASHTWGWHCRDRLAYRAGYGLAAWDQGYDVWNVKVYTPPYKLARLRLVSFNRRAVPRAAGSPGFFGVPFDAFPDVGAVSIRKPPSAFLPANRADASPEGRTVWDVLGRETPDGPDVGRSGTFQVPKSAQ